MRKRHDHTMILVVAVVCTMVGLLPPPTTAHAGSTAAATVQPPRPIIALSSARIAAVGVTTLAVSLDPNGANLAGFAIRFGLNPTAIKLLSVSPHDSTIQAVGTAGGSSLGFGGVFLEDRTKPFPVGTIRVEGLASGGQLQLLWQSYTDNQLSESIIETPSTVATVISNPAPARSK